MPLAVLTAYSPNKILTEQDSSEGGWETQCMSPFLVSVAPILRPNTGRTIRPHQASLSTPQNPTKDGATDAAFEPHGTDTSARQKYGQGLDPGSWARAWSQISKRSEKSHKIPWVTFFSRTSRPTQWCRSLFAPVPWIWNRLRQPCIRIPEAPRGPTRPAYPPQKNGPHSADTSAGPKYGYGAGAWGRISRRSRGGRRVPRS